MSDRLVDYAGKSLAYFIDQANSDIDKCYVITPDFDYDKKPNPSKPGSLIQRALPYAGVELVNDEKSPLTIGNIVYSNETEFFIKVFGTTTSSVATITSDIKQSLYSATNPATGGVGVVLYNFALASGGFYANAGTLHFEMGPSQYFGPVSVDEQNNTKHRSITPITTYAFRDNTATLLEDMGRVSFYDS